MYKLHAKTFSHKNMLPLKHPYLLNCFLHHLEVWNPRTYALMRDHFNVHASRSI